MKRKKDLLLIIFDCLLVSSITIGVVFSLTGFRFVNVPSLVNTPVYITFTFLSNVFLGLTALISIIYRLIKKDMNLPKWLFVLKVISVSDITITFLVTALYLAPSIGADWWKLYVNNNLFNHLVSPLIGIITFIVLERRGEMKFLENLYSLIPITLFEIFYATYAYSHMDISGHISYDYDFYGLARFGPGITAIFMIAFMAIQFGLCCLYYWINSKKKPVDKNT